MNHLPRRIPFTTNVKEFLAFSMSRGITAYYAQNAPLRGLTQERTDHEKVPSMRIIVSELITGPISQKRDRRKFIGGSDARIIMSADEAALIRLWKEKRGEAEPEDFSDNLIVQLGVATEALNRNWYERNTGRTVGDVQRWVQHRFTGTWPPHSTGSSTTSTPCSRPSSCCPGRSRKRRPPKSTWPSSLSD